MKKITLNNLKSKSLGLYFVLITLLLTPLNAAFSFAYIFAGEANGVDVVAHPIGYFGTGGVVSLTVGVDATSTHADDMEIAVQNVVTQFNQLTSTTPNILLFLIPNGTVDFQSVLLHEMGHSLGLAHCNLATESQLPFVVQDYTKSTNGANNTFDYSSGPDGIIGSEDDVRSDDVNLNYFKIADNNPFTSTAIMDQTTYSRDLADLPSGVYSANGARDVGVSLGFNRTESVMNQGTNNSEAQRTLIPDDVAGLSYAEAGVDEIAGTADDYTIVLNYVGQTNSADILIDFDNAQTGFAVSQSGAAFITGDHVRITTNRIYFNTGSNWYFNQVLSVEDNQLSDSDLTVYPNPTNNIVSISNPGSLKMKSVNIYDINGRLILANDMTSNPYGATNIDLSSFDSGMYLFVIKTENGEYHKQIIKE